MKSESVAEGLWVTTLQEAEEAAGVFLKLKKDALDLSHNKRQLGGGGIKPTRARENSSAQTMLERGSI